MKASDQYLKIVEWSEADQCYVGSCPSLMFGGVHGDDEIEVYRELCQAVNEWIEYHQSAGNPLPKATMRQSLFGELTASGASLVQSY